MRIPVQTPKVTIGPQIGAMQRHFPHFTRRRVNNVPTWHGTLQPFAASPVYTIVVSYRYPKAPRVRVSTPSLRSDAPHRYPDGSLCLYYPRDESWTPNMFISETIVPWAALWLAFYELWLQTGQWYGPEAPHRGPKRG